MSCRNKSKPPWCNLCIDILINISNRLEFIDHLRFRAVCSSFRAVNPLPLHPFPLLPFPIIPHDNESLEGHFSLTEVTTLNIQPLDESNNKCWLIKVEASQVEVGGKVHLKMLNQLSTYYLDDEYHKELPEYLDLLRNRVTIISKGYYLKQENNSLDDEENQEPERVFVSWKEDDFAVMVIHSNGMISVWRTGDQQWTHIDNGQGQCDDVVFRKGKFYAVDNTGLTLTVDKQFNVTKVASSLPRSKQNYGYGKVLVEIEGDLYLILKYRKRNVKKVGNNPYGSRGIFPYGFEGFKLNEDKFRWVRIYNLNDVLLFLDPHCAFSISGKNFPRCKKNSIYVSYDDLYDDDYGRGYLFNMRDCSAKPLSFDRSVIENFWPPPSWI